MVVGIIAQIHDGQNLEPLEQSIFPDFQKAKSYIHNAAVPNVGLLQTYYICIMQLTTLVPICDRVPRGISHCRNLRRAGHNRDVAARAVVIVEITGDRRKTTSGALSPRTKEWVAWTSHFMIQRDTD